MTKRRAKLVLNGGPKKDRLAAHEWILMVQNDAVVREMQGRWLPRFRHYGLGVTHSLMTRSGAVCLGKLSGVR
jgi:hypothetical protein